jgi:hypothetical protein
MQVPTGPSITRQAINSEDALELNISSMAAHIACADVKSLNIDVFVIFIVLSRLFASVGL